MYYRNKALIIFCMAMICLAILPKLSGADQSHLRINCTIHSPYEAFFFRLVEEICTRNSIVIKHNTPPVGRSLIRVDQGIDDGDGPRVKGLESTYPNLICVPEPFGNFTFGAFITDKDVKINRWSSLSKLNVAYIHGWKIFEDNVTSAASITKVKNAELLFKLIDSGRADAVLITKLAGYDMIQKLGLKNIKFAEPPLASKSNYLYLNNRHRDLAHILAQTLRDLKSDGTYDRIHSDMMSSFGMD